MLMAEKTIERVYTIPLRSGWVSQPRTKRSNRAVRDVRDFVRRHTKVDKITLSKGINELIFARGFQKPPGRIKVEVSGDIEGVSVKLPGEAIAEKKAKKGGGIEGLRDRLTGKGSKKEDAKKALKERIDKELTKEKVDAIVEKAIKEEETKQDKAMPAKAKKAEDAVEKALEKVEASEEKQKA